MFLVWSFLWLNFLTNSLMRSGILRFQILFQKPLDGSFILGFMFCFCIQAYADLTQNFPVFSRFQIIIFSLKTWGILTLRISSISQGKNSFCRTFMSQVFKFGIKRSETTFMFFRILSKAHRLKPFQTQGQGSTQILILRGSLTCQQNFVRKKNLTLIIFLQRGVALLLVLTWRRSKFRKYFF